PGWPVGMSRTAMACAATVPSFRTRCTWLPPGSTKKLEPAVYTCGVQLGSSPSYSVTVPAVMVTRVGPGCVCHPVLPPGCQTLLSTNRSDCPCVFSNDSHGL